MATHSNILPHTAPHHQAQFQRGISEKPLELLQHVTTSKMARWETMHDTIFDYLQSAEEQRLGFDAQLE